MKQRDMRGRYKRVYRKASRWEVLTLYSMLGGILVTIAYNTVTKPHVFEVVNKVEAAVVEEPVPAEVIVEVAYTKEDIERHIRATFTEEPNTAVAVAKSESGVNLKADAYNPEWHYDKYGKPICQGSYGVMQIACVHNIKDPEALFDVKFNLEVARRIYEARGSFKDWGGYTNKSYKKYLPQDM